MSARIDALLEERKKAFDRMQEIRAEAAKNEGGNFTAEQRQNFDEADARVGELTGDIEREQRGDATQRELERAMPQLTTPVEARAGDGSDEQADNKPNATVQYREAFETFLRRGADALRPEQRMMLRENYIADDGETRALAVGTNTAGGYTVPPGFRDVLIETMKWYGSVRAVATNINTDSGQPLQWPTFNGTAQVGRILAENTQLSQTDPAFGTATLGAYMYVSDLVLVPLQFLQDSAIDASSFLARILGTRIGRIQNQHFSTGTGTSQPLGIGTSPTTGVTLPTGNTTTITYAGLVSLIHSIDPAYRYGGSAQFMLNDASLAAIRQLVDTQGHPLWQPSLQAGVADNLLGYGYVVNNDLPVPAANAKSVLFGDFQRGYIVRDVIGVNVRRLDERYADFLQVGWFGYARADATVQDAAAYKALVQSAT